MYIHIDVCLANAWDYIRSPRYLCFGTAGTKFIYSQISSLYIPILLYNGVEFLLSIFSCLINVFV